MELGDLILEGKTLSHITDKNELHDKYNLWSGKVRMYLDEKRYTQKVQEEVKVKMHYSENEYSETETIMALKKSLESTIQILEEKAYISEKRQVQQAELMLLDRILDNFYMYYRAMYKHPVHKRGTLTLETLSAVQIGNEYDLQRMLYSILLPVFPTLRQEVYSDNGYGGMRADFYLDTYNLVIEIKCTRESLSEKQLVEELGADGFHYGADYIYFFIFDKIGVIKNPEAFKHAFAREKGKDGKTIKTFILQAREL